MAPRCLQRYVDAHTFAHVQALVVLSGLLALAFVLVAATIPVSRLAVLLFVPYVAWLTFATALNYSLVCLNGCVLHARNATNF